ncbi:hypothetical protein WA026_018257 [Henosepilachna vigintioctopunctata]|uniref:Uncharacterized protein n=1 Tax=Henosepilachna vigintioctopunctata TaxID=420089 RepID=A0AAW1VA46_9CUCU
MVVKWGAGTYDAWTHAKNKIEKLEDTIKQLQKEIEYLEQITEKNTSQTGNEHTEYTTDEEELSKGTEWIRSKHYKKRRLNDLLSSPQQRAQDVRRAKESDKPKKAEKQPPVVIEGIKENYNKIHKELGLTHFQIKLINGENIKVNVFDSENYRKLTSKLKENWRSWHSYENKQNRPFPFQSIVMNASFLS